MSTRQLKIALLGNPNSGKTSIFNALTGLRYTTANYPGVTVEKKTGYLAVEGAKEKIAVLDLPGTYSLVPRSLDEEIVHDILLGFRLDTETPDLLVIVMDATNLERNLYLAIQVLETGLPAIFVLNMWDLAKSNGITIDLKKLESWTGAACVATAASKNQGIRELKHLINKRLKELSVTPHKPATALQIPSALEQEVSEVGKLLEPVLTNRKEAARGEALRLIGDIGMSSPFYRVETVSPKLRKQVLESRKRLDAAGIEWDVVENECRYRQIETICRDVVHFQTSEKFTVSERMDQILTHRVWGLLFFMAIMGVIFQSIFTWAEFPMKALESAIKNLGSFTGGILPAGQLNSLVVDGMIAGVGNVVVFLPQIFLLFFFIALLEDFGYMARAAFVLDRIMKKVGLNGKAFLPLLSSFACAVPGVMATRTIENKSDRLATILVAPLMSCSARLPVYALMIGAFIPAGRFYGVFSYKAVTLFSLYFLSLLTGLGLAALFRRTLLKGNHTPFIFELPPYRLPNIKSVFRTMWDRGKEFIYRAGTIIFCISIILWFLASYPKDPALEKNYQTQRQTLSATLTGEALNTELANLERTVSGDRLKISFAGRLGHAIEPVIEPLGFNWKIGIGLIASFAAREVLVSTLAIVYNIGQEADETSVDLISALQAEKDPVTGKPAYSPLVAISLMVFFVLACQCMSTLAIVKRETNTWGWPVFMFTYMTILAWVGSFLVYQGGRLLGF